MYKSNTEQTIEQLAEEFCQDIENVANKPYLIQALISHICYWKRNISEELIEKRVNAWFHNLRKEAFGI